MFLLSSCCCCLMLNEALLSFNTFHWFAFVLCLSVSQVHPSPRTAALWRYCAWLLPLWPLTSAGGDAMRPSDPLTWRILLGAPTGFERWQVKTRTSSWALRFYFYVRLHFNQPEHNFRFYTNFQSLPSVLFLICSFVIFGSSNQWLRGEEISMYSCRNTGNPSEYRRIICFMNIQISIYSDNIY